MKKFYMLFIIYMFTPFFFSNSETGNHINDYQDDCFDIDENYLRNIAPDLNKNLLIEDIKKKYEKKIYNIDHLFYPAKKCDKMYIIFSGAQKNKYML